MGDTPNRFLIVSLGSIGRRHLRNLRAVCPSADIAVLRLSSRGEANDIELANFVTSDIQEAIAFRPQAAIIASPASTHQAVAVELARHGIHLMIEKPLACDAESASAIVDAARNAGIVCMVGYNLRYKQSLLKVREMLAAGAVGTVLSVRAEVGQYLPTWRPEQDYRTSVSAQAELGGGALLELSHELDYLLWLFGMPDKVHCVMGHYSELDIDAEDLVNLSMEYADPRRLINVHMDFIQREVTRKCHFIGSEGTMLWDAIEDRIFVKGSGAANGPQITGPFDPDGNRAYMDELEHFIAVIADDQIPAPDKNQGLRVLHVVDAARRSARVGATIALEYNNDQ
jgi:predicted dehydrogenase